MFNPGDKLTCTNKTYLAGVVTGPKPSRIQVCFLSYPCGNKKSKNSVSRSVFDFRYKPGVFAEPVLELNLNFVLLSKILRLLKWLFVLQIPRVTVYRDNAEHIRVTAFRWRCDEVEMRRTCLEAQKSIQTKVVINS